MTRYLVGRAAAALLVVWAAVTLLFLLIRVSGDPTALLIDPAATQEQYEALRSYYGLDQPLHVQYLRFLEQLTQGDLGRSFWFRAPALEIVLERLPATALLTGAALVLATLVAVPLGVMAAVRRNSPADYAASLLTVIGQSMPNYWLGIGLILIFAVELRLLPTSGFGEFRHLILPMATLALAPAAKYLRLVRSEMIGVLHQDYIRTARSKGLGERQIQLRHAVKNASIPVVTIIGTDVGFLLGGAVITETVFSWPGVGSLMVDAVLRRDYPVVQAGVLVITIIVVVTNLAFDLIYAVLDPRIHLGTRAEP